MSTSESTVVPGNPEEWRSFDHDEYDPKAEVGGDDDALGELLKELATADPPFGIVIVIDPVKTVHPDLIQRLAGACVPTRVSRSSRGGGKAGEKKPKKDKKEKKEKKPKKDKDED